MKFSTHKRPLVHFVTYPYHMIITYIEKFYYLNTFCMAFFISFLNMHVHDMQGLFKHYLLFKSVITSGFTKEPFITFPMWGYGWLLCITENRFFLIGIQQILGLCALWIFSHHMKKCYFFTPKSIALFKFLMIINIPWYAFHACIFANSIAVSLWTLSFVYLHKAIQKRSWLALYVSAFLFGLSLNFRSDYIVLPLAFAIILSLFHFSKENIKKIFVWIIFTYSLLIPWAFYTKKACGHYLFTSTNGGLVCFIGLGDDPNNTWGIIHQDEDPVAQQILKEKGLQQNKESYAISCTYKADQILKKEFFKQIFKNPQAYLKKCITTFFIILKSNMHIGSFFNHLPVKASLDKLIKNKQNIPLSFFLNNPRVLMQELSYRYSHKLLLLSPIILLLTTFFAFYFANTLFLLIIVWCWYQFALCVFASWLPTYMTNILLPLIACVSYIVSCFQIVLMRLFASFLFKFRQPLSAP